MTWAGQRDDAEISHFSQRRFAAFLLRFSPRRTSERPNTPYRLVLKRRDLQKLAMTKPPSSKPYSHPGSHHVLLLLALATCIVFASFAVRPAHANGQDISPEVGTYPNCGTSSSNTCPAGATLTFGTDSFPFFSCTPPNGQAIQLTWDWGDGSQPTVITLSPIPTPTVTVDHSYSSAGTYTVTDSDNCGDTGSGTIVIGLAVVSGGTDISPAGPGNSVPTPLPVGQPGQPITFQIYDYQDITTLTSLCNDQLTEVTWNWGDGSAPTDVSYATPPASLWIYETHTYSTAGTYTITTSDNCGNTGSTIFVVGQSAAPPTPPVTTPQVVTPPPGGNVVNNSTSNAPGLANTLVSNSLGFDLLVTLPLTILGIGMGALALWSGGSLEGFQDRWSNGGSYTRTSVGDIQKGIDAIVKEAKASESDVSDSEALINCNLFTARILQDVYGNNELTGKLADAQFGYMQQNWREVDATCAQSLANQGYPAVAATPSDPKAPNGHGHTAVVYPRNVQGLAPAGKGGFQSAWVVSGSSKGVGNPGSPWPIVNQGATLVFGKYTQPTYFTPPSSPPC